MAPNMPNGSKWLQIYLHISSNISKWLQIDKNDSKLLKIDPKAAKRFFQNFQKTFLAEKTFKIKNYMFVLNGNAYKTRIHPIKIKKWFFFKIFKKLFSCLKNKKMHFFWNNWKKLKKRIFLEEKWLQKRKIALFLEKKLALFLK